MPNQTGQDAVLVKDRSGAIVAAVSRQVVGIYAEHFGRGPTKAKTVWRAGVVVCVLEDVFTRPEQVLIEGGRFAQVRNHRGALHETIEPLLRAAIEEMTGFRVKACLGQVGVEGVAVETFVLAERLPAALP
jgi:uncharacterized protein YbcI